MVQEWVDYAQTGGGLERNGNESGWFAMLPIQWRLNCCTSEVLVACPFFMPDQKFLADWPFPRRLPLGAGFSGTCTAPGHENIRPSDEELKSGCNMGYARSCKRLPLDRHADCIRFVLGEGTPGTKRVCYTCEREHLPVGSGELTYDIGTGGWQQRHSDARIQRMAECYVETKLESQEQKSAAVALQSNVKAANTIT